jgi:hypothetical protein
MSSLLKVELSPRTLREALGLANLDTHQSSERFQSGDVINMGIAILTNGAVPHDGLRPHTDLLSDSPTLGNPH